MNYAKAIYHRIVPARIRNPIGLFRRDLADRIARILTPIPLPPRQLLRNIQLTPWAREYLGVGRRSARSLLQQIAYAGMDPEKPAIILDFGCGSGRILRYFKRPAWELHGCDVDAGAIEWSSKALPFVHLQVCATAPPLPYRDSSFDGIVSISVFTHFSPEDQRAWAGELARILRPGGVLLVSTMGPSVLRNFPQFAMPEDQKRLAEDGALFFRNSGAFNNSAAFHSVAGVVRTFSPLFFLERWLEQGLDGFQDLSVLRRLP